MFDVNNYKGVYFGNDTNEQQFYEGEAHFKYKVLCEILENLLLTMPLERKGVSEEPKRKSNLDFLESNDDNKNTRNIKPLIESLTQKLTDITKDKGNDNNINMEIFTFGEGRSENNNNGNVNVNLINKSRNIKTRNNDNVPNNSKIQPKNQSTNNSQNKKKNKMNIQEDIKHSFDFRKNILQKMSYIRNNKKKNFLSKKILNISHGKYNNNSRNTNNNFFDILKIGNTSKDILNKTTNMQKMITLYSDINNQSSSLSKSKNSNVNKSKEVVSQKIRNYNYNPNSSSLHNKSISSNKPKKSPIITKKRINTGNIIINPNNNISKRHLLFNLLKKTNNNNHNKALSINDKSSKSNIDTISYNTTNYNNNNYAEISLLSDLNSSNSKKKISNIMQSNHITSNDNNSHNITNNNIILKPKINISFVNNINTIPAKRINKSRNKQLKEENSNNTLNKLNTSFKKSLLSEIYKTTHIINKKPLNFPNKNKLVKNMNMSKPKNIKTSINKLSRNVTNEKVLKNSINLTEQYMNLKKNINHLKINKSKNNLNKKSFDMGKVSIQKNNISKSNNKVQIKSNNRSFFK